MDFIMADSSNLPKVDGDMLTTFLEGNSNFSDAASSNDKTSRSMSQVCSDNSVGNVQIYVEDVICTVQARVTPDHKLRNKPYLVEVVINQEKEEILQCECKENCAASEGGCKHALALLLWLHRRSEEPEPTSVTPYWRNSAVSSIGNRKLDLNSIFNRNVETIKNTKVDYDLQAKASKFARTRASIYFADVKTESCLLFGMERELEVDGMNIHHAIIEFQEITTAPLDADTFLKFVSGFYSTNRCQEIMHSTYDQSNCTSWFDYKYGRISASKLYEASRCKELEGSLVEAILSTCKMPETTETIRVKRLKEKIIKDSCAIRGIVGQKCGIFLNSEYPALGATPDAISRDYCLEVKCPESVKAVLKYISKKGVVQRRFLTQLRMQMFFACKKRGLLCVASPNHEVDNHITIIEVEQDEEEVKYEMERAMVFWKAAVFSALIKR